MNDVIGKRLAVIIGEGGGGCGETRSTDAMLSVIISGRNRPPTNGLTVPAGGGGGGGGGGTPGGASPTLITASPGSGAPEYKESEVRNVVRDYAACVVKGNHKFASQAIMSDVDNGEIIKKYSMLISSECLGRVAGSVQLKFSDDFCMIAGYAARG